jgi:hypothetical protein
MLKHFKLYEKGPLKIFFQGPLWSNFMTVKYDCYEGSHDRETTHNCSQNKMNSLYHVMCNLKFSHNWWRSHFSGYGIVLVGNLLVEELSFDYPQDVDSRILQNAREEHCNLHEEMCFILQPTYGNWDFIMTLISEIRLCCFRSGRYIVSNSLVRFKAHTVVLYKTNCRYKEYLL